MSDTLGVGQRVVFFQGRRPMRGKVKEVLSDGRVVILVKNGDSISEELKDEEEVKPVSEVQGKTAKIRFL